MSQTSKLAFLNFKIDTCASSLPVKITVGNFVVDLLETAIVKDIDFVYVPFDNFPAFRAIQKHRFNVIVVSVHFSIKTILFGLADVFESSKYM